MKQGMRPGDLIEKKELDAMENDIRQLFTEKFGSCEMNEDGTGIVYKHSFPTGGRIEVLREFFTPGEDNNTVWVYLHFENIQQADGLDYASGDLTNMGFRFEGMLVGNGVMSLSFRSTDIRSISHKLDELKELFRRTLKEIL